MTSRKGKPYCFYLAISALFDASNSYVEVFRFWTFLKSACAQGLYGALDLKNTPCAKKIQKFYLYSIAHGGLISMPISFQGESPCDVIFV